MKRSVLAWLLVLLITACNRQQTPRLHALDVLHDFSFVGSGTAKLVNGSEIDFAYVAPHGLDQLAVPTKLELMTQYIFHYKGGISNQSLAIKEFPARLMNAGFTVVEAPTSQGGFSYPSFAGPIFYIKFSDGKHIGYIFNQVEGRLNGSRTFKNEDYVLVFIK